MIFSFLFSHYTLLDSAVYGTDGQLKSRLLLTLLRLYAFWPTATDSAKLAQ